MFFFSCIQSITGLKRDVPRDRQNVDEGSWGGRREDGYRDNLQQRSINQFNLY